MTLSRCGARPLLRKIGERRHATDDDHDETAAGATGSLSKRSNPTDRRSYGEDELVRRSPRYEPSAKRRDSPASACSGYKRKRKDIPQDQVEDSPPGTRQAGNTTTQQLKSSSAENPESSGNIGNRTEAGKSGMAVNQPIEIIEDDEDDDNDNDDDAEDEDDREDEDNYKDPDKSNAPDNVDTDNRTDEHARQPRSRGGPEGQVPRTMRSRHNLRSKPPAKPARREKSKKHPPLRSSAFKMPKILVSISPSKEEDIVCSAPSSNTADNVNRLNDDSSRCTSSPSSILSVFSFSEDEDELSVTAQKQAVVCPMCKKEIAQQFLPATKPRTGRMTLRDQGIFCRDHRRLEAADISKRCRYPTIDWDGLEDRLEAYDSTVRQIITGQISSTFKSDIAARHRTGRQKTLMQDLAGGSESCLPPGYYGGKGARIISDHVLSNFAQELRSNATSDPLIASLGVAGFIQAVLVPELGSLLIQEDMKVNKAESCQILRESAWIGELLNVD